METTKSLSPQKSVLANSNAGYSPRVNQKHNFERSGEKVSSQSYTIPDDSFSIADLFQRHRQGAPLPPGLERPVTFPELASHEDIDMSYVSRMDLVEISQLKNRVQNQIAALKLREAELVPETTIPTTKKDEPADQKPG